MIARIRGAGGALLFWGSSLSVGIGTFIVLAVLARHLPKGGLAAATAVVGLSFVMAVIPGAVQLRATGEAAAGRQPGPAPVGLLAVPAGALALTAPVLGWALAVPVTAIVLVAVQLPLAAALGVERGALVGAGRLGRASATFGADAMCRLVGGVVLGLAWGASGVAAALVLSAFVPLVGQRPWRRMRLPPQGMGAALGATLSIGALGVLANVDVVVARRVLGAEAADRYALAAMPAKGIFFALFAVSLLAVPIAARSRTRRELLQPVLLVLAGAGVATVTVLAGRPLLPVLLGRPEPAMDVLAPLALAMGLAAATAMAISMAVVRGVRRPWQPALLAAAALIVTSVAARPGTAGFALAVLVAQAAAAAAAVRALASSATSPLPAGVPA